MSLFGNDTFYFSLTKKYIGYFGTIFNELEIERTLSNGGKQRIRVPILYGPRDKMLARYDADPNIQRAAALATPRMSFELKGMSYNAENKLPSLGRHVRKDPTDLNKAKFNFTPVPYDLSFELSIMTKNFEDAVKVVEQILPRFSPEFTATLNLIPEMNIKEDIPLILNSHSWEDTYTGDISERRNVTWNLQFTMKAYYYGPTVIKPLIKFANVNFLVGSPATSNTVVEYINTRPGLTANGTPTSNAAASIPATEIAIDDDFGYIVTWTSDTQSLD